MSNATIYLETGVDLVKRRVAVAHLAKLIDRIVGLKKFDAIAVRGTSGLLIGPILADKLDKELIVVRKPEDGAHSTRKFEAGKLAKGFRFIIVDDLVSSGRTMIDTFNAVDGASYFDNAGDAAPYNPVLCGLFCYHQQEWDTHNVVLGGKSNSVYGFCVNGKDVTYTPKTRVALDIKKQGE